MGNGRARRLAASRAKPALPADPASVQVKLAHKILLRHARDAYESGTCGSHDTTTHKKAMHCRSPRCRVPQSSRGRM